jgi:hypothetical protein
VNSVTPSEGTLRMAYMPSSFGSVYVRPHTRCNYRKCWSVRGYYRSR